MRRTPLVLALLALAGVSSRSESVGCVAPFAIAHAGQDVSTGGFLIAELAGRPIGPPIRFWAHNHYAQANNGSQGQYNPRAAWFSGGSSRGASPEWFFVDQANWLGNGIAGCWKELTDRTVVEVSYLIDEGRTSHYTGYIIASVKFTPGIGFNLDDVTDGNGGGPALVRMVPVPVPQPQGAAVANSLDKSLMDITVGLADAQSHGDGGAPNLIRGYEIFYANDSEPTSSSPGAYRPVRNPQAPSTPLGLVSYGMGAVRVAVPQPTKATYLVARLIYADPTAPLSSLGTSGHSQAIAPPGGTEAEPEEEADVAEAAEESAADDTASDTPSEDSAVAQDDAAPAGTGRNRGGQPARPGQGEGTASEAPSTAPQVVLVPTVVGGGVIGSINGGGPGTASGRPGRQREGRGEGADDRAGQARAEGQPSSATAARAIAGFPLVAVPVEGGEAPAAESARNFAGPGEHGSLALAGGESELSAEESQIAREGGARGLGEGGGSTRPGGRARGARRGGEHVAADGVAGDGEKSTRAGTVRSRMSRGLASVGEAFERVAHEAREAGRSPWRLLDLTVLFSAMVLGLAVWLGRRA